MRALLSQGGGGTFCVEGRKKPKIQNAIRGRYMFPPVATGVSRALSSCKQRWGFLCTTAACLGAPADTDCTKPPFTCSVSRGLSKRRMVLAFCSWRLLTPSLPSPAGLRQRFGRRLWHSMTQPTFTRGPMLWGLFGSRKPRFSGAGCGFLLVVRSAGVGGRGAEGWGI